MPIIRDIMGNSKFGSGFNGGETAIIHIYLRLITEYFLSNKRSIAILFLDVASAFATVLRKILFDTNQGDEAWLKSLKDVGFTVS